MRHALYSKLSIPIEGDTDQIVTMMLDYAKYADVIAEAKRKERVDKEMTKIDSKQSSASSEPKAQVGAAKDSTSKSNSKTKTASK